jgi:hypothetical protein
MLNLFFEVRKLGFPRVPMYSIIVGAMRPTSVLNVAARTFSTFSMPLNVVDFQFVWFRFSFGIFSSSSVSDQNTLVNLTRASLFFSRIFNHDLDATDAHFPHLIFFSASGRENVPPISWGSLPLTSEALMSIRVAQNYRTRPRKGAERMSAALFSWQPQAASPSW